ncbi:MAG: TMEM175 family protein [Bacteroidota bacterium]|nr:TMEM175 family protein [Bacteroidota bacterium]
MTKTRLEAFSDGVIAIIITIMVLDIKVPHGDSFTTLRPVIPVFISYVISFLFVGIYWGNHHHLLQAAKKVNSGILLTNLHLLFWLSLVPVTTGWMGENHFAPDTVILYAIVALMCGLAYAILQRCILQSNEMSNELAAALRRQTTKALISVFADIVAIPMAFVNPVISLILFVLQSSIWLIPDRHVERAIEHENSLSE